MYIEARSAEAHMLGDGQGLDLALRIRSDGV
eukprot:COSAG04_NODE_28545_length_275_cov_0.579545_1_plen_30_part_10